MKANHRRFATADSSMPPPPTSGELLEASYLEMLECFKRHYAFTGDLAAKEIIDRAEHALTQNR